MATHPEDLQLPGPLESNTSPLVMKTEIRTINPPTETPPEEWHEVDNATRTPKPHFWSPGYHVDAFLIPQGDILFATLAMTRPRSGDKDYSVGNAGFRHRLE